MTRHRDRAPIGWFILPLALLDVVLFFLGSLISLEYLESCEGFACGNTTLATIGVAAWLLLGYVIFLFVMWLVQGRERRTGLEISPKLRSNEEKLMTVGLLMGVVATVLVAVGTFELIDIILNP